MWIASKLRPVVLPVIDLVYPPRCPLCSERLMSQGGLCASCWSDLAIPGAPACGRCGRPFEPEQIDGAVCAPCMADPPRHDGIASATLYNDTSRAIVLRFKHGGSLGLAPLMARLIAAKLAPVHSNENRVFVPVPLHWSRLWKRGYNQAAVLAAALQRQSGGRLVVDGLLRRKRTRPLGGMGKLARARTLTGAITANARRKSRIAGADVILVDDVLTSGATTEACVKALKKAGARTVVIACFARVLDESLHLA